MKVSLAPSKTNTITAKSAPMILDTFVLLTVARSLSASFNSPVNTWWMTIIGFHNLGKIWPRALNKNQVDRPHKSNDSPRGSLKLPALLDLIIKLEKNYRILATKILWEMRWRLGGTKSSLNKQPFSWKILLFRWVSDLRQLKSRVLRKISLGSSFLVRD